MYINDQVHAPATLYEEDESPVFIGQEAVLYFKASPDTTANRITFMPGGNQILEASLQLVTLFTATQSNRFTHD